MVSIIVPVYNMEDYLEECLNSLMNQVYSDIEVIMVDDGSKDGSGKICDAYAKKDARFQVIHQENQGLSGARNTAIAVARGTYLMFVDSDDYVDTQYVSTLVQAIEQEDADMAIAGYYNATKEDDGTMSLRECTLFPEKSVMTGAEILPQRFEGLKVYYVVPWNKIYKRELFDETCQYPVGKICEDAWISLDLYAKCKKVVCIKERLYYYRMRQGSIIHAGDLRWLKAQTEWLEREILYFSKSENKDHVFFPARCYVSMICKNKNQFVHIKTENTSYCWKQSMGVLLHDKRNSIMNKMKYHYYNFLYMTFRGKKGFQ